jgi:hypothetical protein
MQSKILILNLEVFFRSIFFIQAYSSDLPKKAIFGKAICRESTQAHGANFT